MLIDNCVGDIVLAFIDVFVRELKKALNSMLTTCEFNLVNKFRKALVVGLSLIVIKNIVLDLLMRLNDGIRHLASFGSKKRKVPFYDMIPQSQQHRTSTNKL